MSWRRNALVAYENLKAGVVQWLTAALGLRVHNRVHLVVVLARLVHLMDGVSQDQGCIRQAGRVRLFVAAALDETD